MPRLLRDLGPEERAPVIATIRHEAEAAAWRTVPNAQRALCATDGRGEFELSRELAGRPATGRSAHRLLPAGTPSTG
jgi:hypothetical protein